MSTPHLISRLQFLASQFGHQLPDENLKQYAKLLSHLGPEQIDRAVSNLVQSFVPTTACPFPAIRHILQACGDSPDDRARLAIARLKVCIRRVGQYESITLQDPALHFAIDSCGGWASVCLWTDKEWDVNEGRLLETYKAAKAANHAGPVYLPGIAERDSGYFRLHIVQDEKVSSVLCIGSVPPDLINRLTVSHKKQLEVTHVN